MNDPDGVREYLVVAIADSLFALYAKDVESAVAPRYVTPLPFVPAYVEGLVSVNDRIVPLIDLRGLLQPGGSPPEQSELVVIETERAPCALRVDRVVAAVSTNVTDTDASPPDTGQPVDNGAPARQLIRHRFMHEGHAVLVLDSNMLGELVCTEEMAPTRRGLLGRVMQETRADAVVSDACIVVHCGTETYGIALAVALEIVDTAPATPVPGAPAFVEGMALVRGEVLLVLSLARALGRIGGRDDGLASRNVVVVEHLGSRYGLRVDSVDGILTYAAHTLRAIEAGADDRGGELAGVIVAGERAIGLVGMDRLFSVARSRLLAPFLPARARTGDVVQEATRLLLEVEVAGEWLGIPLQSVRRIARYSASLELESGDGSRVRGAVSIEGAILPVLDLQEVLGLDGLLIGEHGAWVVVGVEGREWAIAVNEARRIVEVAESAVESIGSHVHKLVQAVVRVDAQLLSLLNIDPLLEAA